MKSPTEQYNSLNFNLAEQWWYDFFANKGTYNVSYLSPLKKASRLLSILPKFWGSFLLFGFFFLPLSPSTHTRWMLDSSSLLLCFLLLCLCLLWCLPSSLSPVLVLLVDFLDLCLLPSTDCICSLGFSGEIRK